MRGRTTILSLVALGWHVSSCRGATETIVLHFGENILGGKLIVWIDQKGQSCLLLLQLLRHVDRRPEVRGLLPIEEDHYRSQVVLFSCGIGESLADLLST